MDKFIRTIMSRREALRAFLIATTAGAAGFSGLTARADTPAPPPPPPGIPPSGPFALPALPYEYDALEPHIDAETMHLHHDKHHATYVKNLNAAAAKHPELAGKAVEELIADLTTVPDDIRSTVRNNGGGHYNHSLFWQMMKKGGGGAPSGALGAAIDKKFGSYATFQEQFTKAALGQFGSGWAWLTVDAAGDLAIEGFPNQDSPISSGRTPLLGIDVWEHAYYLKYQNKRVDYVTAFYNVIDWDFVAGRFASAKRA